MKALRIALSSALIVSGVALAQAAAPAAPAAPATPAPAAGGAAATAPAAAAITLAAADVTKLKTWITDQKKASVAAPAGFMIAIGSVVPMTIMVFDIPATAGVTFATNATVKAATDVKFTVIGDKLVLVNAPDRKILYVFA